MSVLKQLTCDESGFIVSTELVLVGTVVVMGMIAGLTCVRDAVTGELKDLAGAIGSLNQSYCYSGFNGGYCRCCRLKSQTVGSSFVDHRDGEFDQESEDISCPENKVELKPGPKAETKANEAPSTSTIVVPGTVASPQPVQEVCPPGTLPGSAAPHTITVPQSAPGCCAGETVVPGHVTQPGEVIVLPPPSTNGSGAIIQGSPAPHAPVEIRQGTAPAPTPAGVPVLPGGPVEERAK